jgi:hypothetical protein
MAPMKFKTTAGAGIVAVAITAGQPAAAVPPSGATCIASPTSKDPFTEGKEYAAQSLAGRWREFADPNGAERTKLHDQITAAQKQRETSLHAVSAIAGFLARAKDDDWTAANVNEAAGILSDLGNDKWQVRSFVGDGKGDKVYHLPRFLAEVTKALTGDIWWGSIDDIDQWREFVTDALDQRVRYFEDREKMAVGYLTGLGMEGISPFLVLSAYEAKHGEYSYLAAARLMTESLNTPASKSMASRRGEKICSSGTGRRPRTSPIKVARCSTLYR